MMIRINTKSGPSNKARFICQTQRGATLITALMLLLVMTIISISAVKMTSLDVLVSGNDQQKMLLFQETESRLRQLANFKKLNQTFTETGFTENTKIPNAYVFSSSPGNKQAIIDMQETYPCERKGVASSIGPNAPVCDLYDFQIQLRKQNTRVKDQHHRGAGKMVPKQGSKGSLL